MAVGGKRALRRLRNFKGWCAGNMAIIWFLLPVLLGPEISIDISTSLLPPQWWGWNMWRTWAAEWSSGAASSVLKIGTSWKYHQGYTGNILGTYWEYTRGYSIAVSRSPKMLVEKIGAIERSGTEPTYMGIWGATIGYLPSKWDSSNLFKPRMASKKYFGCHKLGGPEPTSPWSTGVETMGIQCAKAWTARSRVAGRCRKRAGHVGASQRRSLVRGSAANRSEWVWKGGLTSPKWWFRLI